MFFSGRFLFRPCGGLGTGRLLLMAALVVAVLVCVGAPALAQHGGAPEPGSGELRYALPGFAPEAQEPAKIEEPVAPAEPVEPAKAAEPDTGQGVMNMPPPGISWPDPAPKSLVKPQRSAAPPRTAAPAPQKNATSPQKFVAPPPDAAPQAVTSPYSPVPQRHTPTPPPKSVAPAPVPSPAPVSPAPAPSPAPPQAERKSISEPAKELSYPLEGATPEIEAAPAPIPSPAPVRAGRMVESGKTPAPQKTPETGSVIHSAPPRHVDKNFARTTPQWMRQDTAKPVARPPAREPQTAQEPLTTERPLHEGETIQPEVATQAETSTQPEVTGEPGLDLKEKVQRSYAAERDFADENIGYGSSSDLAPQNRRAVEKAQGPVTATPPPMTTRVRAPEEQGQTQEAPRDERVPTDIGPYAWVPASQAPPPEPGSDELPWELSADKVIAHNQNSVVDAEGEVFLQHGNEYLKADFARYFAETGWVYLKGNVEIYFGTDRLSGEEAEFDLANKVGWVKNGQVFMAGPHVYLSGERVNKNWGDTYTFRNAKITTCDGDVPAWSLHAEDAVVELDGYARLWGSSLAIKNQKVAYSPYMVVPAKRDRQSGFLVPRAGQDSRKGFYWDQSYFWAIDDSRDLTANAYIMTDRGVMLGAEYRSKQEWDENLWVRADYLHDSETWDTRSDNYFNSNYLRTNADRFWLRGMYNGTPFSDRNWKVKANLDYVSDAYFLREFKNDVQGYNTTRDYLEKSFGRTLAPWSSNRVSEGVIYRDWDRVTVSAGMRYEQNPFLGNGNQPRSSDVIAQRLPEVNMYLHKGDILEGGLPLEAEGEGQMVYFYRRDGVKGMRYDLSPRVSLPLRNDYGALVPEVGLRGTMYQAGHEGRIQGDTGNSDDNGRVVPDFSLAAFTEVARNYDLGGSRLALAEENVGNRRWSGLRHTIQPRVDYFKRWKVDQDDLPYFDSLDRLAPRDEVVYSITNLLTVKRESVALDKNKNPVIRDDYIDFLRFKLETGYDFDEARRTWRTDAYKRRPFMDILADITLTPGNWFSISSRTWWSPYNGDFTRLDSDVSVWEPGIGRVRVGLDSRRRPDEYKRWSSDVLYRDLSLLHRGLINESDLRINRYREPVDLLYADVQLDYFAPFSFSFQQWYDLRNNEGQETHLSVIYTHQCYQLEAYMWWDQHDENYGVSVRLPGFWD